MIQNNHISIILLLILSLVFASLQAQYDDEVFEELSSEAGLSSTIVTCIIKDSKGYMWFGTQNGLNKFDGYSFTIYKHTDTIPGSISGNYILSMYEDNDKNIWIGTQNNGLNKYHREKDKFEVFRNDSINSGSISSDNIRVITQTPNGTLYIGTGKGLNIFNKSNNSFQYLELPDNQQILNSLLINEIYPDNDGSLWIGTNKGLYRYFPEAKTLQEFHHDPQNDNTLSNDNINALLRSSTGELHIATNLGLNILNPETGNFQRFYYNPDNVFNEAKSELQAIVEDNRGNLWIGSFGGGLIKSDLNSDRVALFVNEPQNSSSISNDHVFSLYFDDAGILWVGTYGGGINKIDLVKIRFDQIQYSPDHNSLVSNDVYSILPGKNEVWFGTDNGISILNKNSDSFILLQSFAEMNWLEGKSIYSLLEDSKGNIWVGTAGSGLAKVIYNYGAKDISTVNRFTKQSLKTERLNDNEVLCLFEEQNGTIWAGTTAGITLINNDQVIATFSNDPADSLSLIDNEVYSISQDNSGNVWIGTYSGLNKFNSNDSTFSPLNQMDGESLLSYTIYSIYCDSEGYVWAGTDNGGLLKINPENNQLLKQFTKKDQLADNVIYGILEDKENNLWLSSNNGITKAIKQGNSENLTFINYNSSNWLKTDFYNFGAFAKGPDETLYFGSFEGVTYFDSDNVKGNNTIPPVYITDFQLFFNPVKISNDNSTPLSKNISETKSIRLKHDQNVLTFGFTALNYIQTDKNMFAFRMEGLQENWTYTSETREAQYLYLPPGDYKFHVRAANNNGIWNEDGASIDIIIIPPFTQTIWFYLILLAGLAIIIIWIMNIRTKRLRATRDKLEIQVQSRTKELRETNKTLQDEIQERKKVQDALAKSEARFRQLIETMNEGFSVQDKEGRINYVNPKLCLMFGYSPNEILGHFPIDFVDDSSPKYKTRFLKHKDDGIDDPTSISSYEMNWKRKDGSIFIAMVSPKPIFDTENNYTGSVAVLTDITDLKNAEKELLVKNMDLNTALHDLKKTQAQLIDSEKMASLGQLTAGVAHEINNPINFVSGNVLPLRRDIKDILEVLHQYDKIVERLNMTDQFDDVEVLKKDIDFDFVLNEIDNLLDGIGEGASRTAEIVKGLRNFSRMDEHELKYSNINEGIDSTLLILHNKLKQRINIKKEYGTFNDIMCYPGQLNQVFLNVLNNAQEAIEGDGEIIIRTWHEDHMVKVSVKDNGRGMTEKVKKKIFDPFYTTKDVGKGTGLGLSISFGIVEKHKGKIEIDSQPGKGTEFIISIPDNLI